MNAKRIYLIKIAPVVLLAGTAYWLLGSDFFAFLTWWEMLFLLGLVFMPVTSRMFQGFDDNGKQDKRQRLHFGKIVFDVDDTAVFVVLKADGIIEIFGAIGLLFGGFSVHGRKKIFGKLHPGGGGIAGGKQTGVRIEYIKIPIVIKAEGGGIGKKHLFDLGRIIFIQQCFVNAVGGGAVKGVV